MKPFRAAICLAIILPVASAAANAESGAEGASPQQTSSQTGGSPQPTLNPQQARLANAAKSMTTVGAWRGTTPCADCSGIDTTLTLYGRAANADSGIYQTTMTYIGRNVTNNIYGRWVRLEGAPDNPNGYIYRLDPERSGGLYYLHANDGSLQQLDGHLNPIAAPGQNFMLKPVTQ